MSDKVNIWSTKFGDKYTDRNSPDVAKRAKWFNKILPKYIKSVVEVGCNKGHNLEAIASINGCLVRGEEINNKAANIARTKGLDVEDYKNLFKSDLVLFSGVLIHINPLDLDMMFDRAIESAYVDYSSFNADKFQAKYILMIENKSDSIETVNSRWYKNAMWTMDFGKEFLDRYENWECVKKGWVNGKKPKTLDLTAPLTNTKTGFHEADYFWLLKRK